MKRSRMKVRPRDRGTDHDAAYAWFVAVTRGRRCVVCNRRHPQMQAHHVIEQQVIRREFPFGAVLIGGSWERLGRDESVPEGYVMRSLQQLLWDIRNGVPVCPTCHEHHTSHSAKIPIDAIPAAAVVFARELNLQHRLGPRFYSYPPTHNDREVAWQ